MPKARSVINGFVSAEVARISGLSLDMVNYLAREGYLRPAYSRQRTRGKVRYYSYRDLIVARMVQGLREAGVELKRLKKAIRALSENDVWIADGREKAVRLLATDGKRIYFPDENDTLVELSKQQQRAFTFVLDVGHAIRDVKKSLSADHAANFHTMNEPLKYANGNR